MNELAVHYSSNKYDWGTPPAVFEVLDTTFRFTVDACADHNNALCKRYWTKDDNFFTQFPKTTESIFMNPPYGRAIGAFVEHLAILSHDGTCGVALLPARTDTRWFRTVWDHANSVLFFRGRLRFVGAPHGAPFPSCIAVFGRNLTYTDQVYLGQLGHAVVLR